VAEDDIHVVLGEQNRDPLRASEIRCELHQPPARARRHAGGGLVHQQESRRSGQCEGELDALGVAVGERRASRFREASHPHAFEQRIGFGAQAVGRARAMPRSAPACESSASCTFSRTVIDANVAATWNVRPTPRRATAPRRQAVDPCAIERYGSAVRP
jgi:hypothetical protein